MPIQQIEVFSTGCPVCKEVIQLIQGLCSGFCQVTTVSVSDEGVADRARRLGLRSFPAVVVDGEPLPFDCFRALSGALADCEWVRQELRAY